MYSTTSPRRRQKKHKNLQNDGRSEMTYPKSINNNHQKNVSQAFMCKKTPKMPAVRPIRRKTPGLSPEPCSLHPIGTSLSQWCNHCPSDSSMAVLPRKRSSVCKHHNITLTTVLVWSTSRCMDSITGRYLSIISGSGGLHVRSAQLIRLVVFKGFQ